MLSVLFSPFFLLFCVATGCGAYLAHRQFIAQAATTLADRLVSLAAAFATCALCVITYCIRLGVYCPARLSADVAMIISAATGLAIAFLCIRCVLADELSAED